MTTPGEALAQFIENIQLRGLELLGRYYGIYRGTVKTDEDPEGLGRIQVVVPDVGGSETLGDWADPAFMGVGPNEGQFHPPPTDARVLVCFEHGKPEHPIYIGGYWAAPEDAPYEVPPEFKKSPPTAKGWFFKAAYFLVENEADNEAVKLVWRRPSDSKESYFAINEDGSVQMQNHTGTYMILNAKDGEEGITLQDSNGNLIATDSSEVKAIRSGGENVTLAQGKATVMADEVIASGKVFNAATGGCTLGQGATEPLVFGNKLLAFINKAWISLLAHQHTASPGGGITSPPVGLVLDSYTTTLNSQKNKGI